VIETGTGRRFAVIGLPMQRKTEPPSSARTANFKKSRSVMIPRRTSNLVFDGERLVLLDWDMAGPNDPFYDLAAVAMFLRMDDPTASALIAAYDAAPPAALPDGFVYARRFVAALCATIFLHLARHAGHAGGDIPADRAPTLLDVHGLMGIGALAPNTAEGAWAFALALVRTITDHG
jgi:hypothetical protein